MLKYALLLISFVCLWGCEEEQNDPLRLDHSVIPRAQNLSLSLDPDQDKYHGGTGIQIEVMKKTDSFRFHARGLAISSAAVISDSMEIPVEVSEGEKGTMTAKLAQALEPGIYTLHLFFSNEYSRKGTGIYKVEYEGKNYLFTQMEPEYARDAFPCWDAPEFKIPWSLTIWSPDQFNVYANAPIRHEQVSLRAGGKDIRFEESKSMPAYLVALAVGDFEAVPVPGFSTKGSVIVPAGKTELAAEAVRVSPPLLTALEDYFLIRYPYEKLDQIAVPEFNYGAMENVGLITYRDTVLLRDPKAMTLGQRQRLALTVAHEMAHMWFGNLVTPKWWDDLWLNESFATWMATKIVNQTFPEFEMANKDIEARQSAFAADSLITSHPIRRPIAASDAMAHLFDALAYNKGMAVLDMVEDWMGVDPFRAGMIRYMKDHAWGNADAFDLAKSLGTVADDEILDIIKSFVTQAGVPLVTVERIGGSKVRVSQSRYAHVGVEFEGTPRWTIPVTLKYGAADGVHERKILLNKASRTIQLDHAAKWIYPNANEKGYYRWLVTGPSFDPLSREVVRLDVRHRLGFINNAAAMFSAGQLGSQEYLETLTMFASDESPEVRQSMVAKLSDFGIGMALPELEENYGTFLAKVLNPMLIEIGLDKAENEGALIEQLRPSLIDALGWQCDDAALLTRASEKARDYMADPYALDSSLAQSYLRLAAKKGDADLFEAYIGHFNTATIPIQKSNYLQGLSAFRDQALMTRALDYTLTDAVPPHLFGTIPYGMAERDENRAIVLEWLKENYDAIRAKVPTHSLSYLPWLACGQSPDLLVEAKSFLLSEGRATQGMEIEFGKVEAVVRLNALLREKEQEALRRFLETR